MQTPHIFIAYAPRGAGLRCALAYLSSERDVYGWYIGPRHDASIASRYFLLDSFFTNLPTRYEAVEAADLHTAWALDEPRRHALAAMQETFAREWLFFRDDPHAVAELEAYGEGELAAGEVNLRFERLSRLDTQQPNWTYYSPNFERPVLRALSKHWPLEFHLHEDDVRHQRAAGPRP